MGALERGLSAGFGAAADLYKSQHLMNLQNRHQRALEEVRHKYRGEERQEAGIIAGQQQEAKLKAQAEAGKTKREHELSRDERKYEASEKETHIKGAYGLKEQEMRSSNRPTIFYGHGGSQYTFEQVRQTYKDTYPMGFDPETDDPISMKEYAKRDLGIPNFMPGPSEEGAVAGATAGKAEKKDSKPGQAPAEDKAKTTQQNARGYYLNLKRRYPDDTEEEIRKEVKKRYPTWKG